MHPRFEIAVGTQDVDGMFAHPGEFVQLQGYLSENALLGAISQWECQRDSVTVFGKLPHSVPCRLQVSQVLGDLIAQDVPDGDLAVTFVNPFHGSDQPRERLTKLDVLGSTELHLVGRPFWDKGKSWELFL